MKLRTIKKVNHKHIKSLREDFKNWILGLGEVSGNPRLTKWAKELNDDALEFCLHLGFSEKAFVQLLSGISVTESFGIESVGNKKVHVIGAKG